MTEPEHPRAQTHQRVLRSTGHRNLPNIVGPWFVRADDLDVYPLHCASVLAVLKPWRDLDDLRAGVLTWSEALETFLASASDRQKSIRANMQYYYQCQESANQADEEQEGQEGQGEQGANAEDPVDEIALQECINGVKLEKAVETRARQREREHAEKAVAIGLKFGWFGGSSGEPWPIQEGCEAGENDLTKIQEWIEGLRMAASRQRLADHPMQTAVPGDSGTVAAMVETVDHTLNPLLRPSVTYEGDITSSQIDIDLSMLTADQLRAVMIVWDHLLEFMAGKKPNQLFMQIQGEGGTGKSLVISKITELFEKYGLASLLRRGAPTGIAASLINGATLHQLAKLHQCNGKIAKKTVEALRAIWGPVEYLIVDEVSMLSKKQLADISEMLNIGKQVEDVNNSTIAFGGLNVIIAGDFHQFPPVVGAGPLRGALYVPDEGKYGMKATNGWKIYCRFKTVVLLKKQFRAQDPEWGGILGRARHGQCTSSDLATIRGQILDPVRDRALRADPESPWSRAVLVTPRHAVRHHWNDLASEHHCRVSKVQLYRSHAYDTYNNKPLDNTLRTLVNERAFPDGGNGSGRADPGNLPDVVQLAVGMKVMVTYNVETELDIANGSQGTIERIITSDTTRHGHDNGHIVSLPRPPLCVLVRLLRTKLKAIGDLDEGVVPIIPHRAMFKVQMRSGRQISVWREQIPLTPAYAFTDYKAQGQTIPHIIMDLATPPTGGLTPFNGYVTLSRSRTAQTVRLLRDFDNKLFTTTPSVYLANEDKRLKQLDAETAHKYAASRRQQTGE